MLCGGFAWLCQLSELGSYNGMQYEDILYVQASQEL